MTEDVIDFSPDGRHDRSPTRHWPSWRTNGAALPLAALGAALAAASCFGEWQSVHIPDEGRQAQTFSSPVAALGPLGAAYLMTAVVLFTAAVLTLFGDRSIRRTARLAGLALSGCALVLLAGTANMLSKTIDGANFRFYPADSMDEITFQLEWGIFAAFAGVVAVGVALVLSRPAVLGEVPQEQREEPEFADDAIDLTVSVHPITR